MFRPCSKLRQFNDKGSDNKLVTQEAIPMVAYLMIEAVQRAESTTVCDS